jgi:hypothetical protein
LNEYTNLDGGIGGFGFEVVHPPKKQQYASAVVLLQNVQILFGSIPETAYDR